VPTTAEGDGEKFSATPGRSAAGNAAAFRGFAPNVFTYQSRISVLLGWKK